MKIVCIVLLLQLMVGLFFWPIFAVASRADEEDKRLYQQWMEAKKEREGK